MICEKCGAEYASGVCPNGCNASKKVKNPIYKKWWFWVIVAVLVVSVASGGDGETAPSDSSNPAGESVTGTVDSTGSTAAQNQSFTYRVGDVLNANGMKITYVKAEKWISDNQFLQPDDGYCYIRLYLSVENTSSSDRYISSFDFTCYADGKKEESKYFGDDALEGGTLSAGRKDEGYIYFMVPENAAKIEVEYETNYWADKKAIFKVEIS